MEISKLTPQEIKLKLRDLNCDYNYYEMKWLKATNEEMEDQFYEKMFMIGDKIDQLEYELKHC